MRKRVQVFTATYFLVIGLKMTETSLHSFTSNAEKYGPKKYR